MKIFSALVLSFVISAPVCWGQLNPSTMPKVGTVSPRFQSYNVEMVEVIGGRFWKPYASTATATPPAAGADPAAMYARLLEQRPPVDLSNPRLRKMAAALGPAYMRVSGTWANNVYFQPTDAAVSTTPPEGFGGVLTHAEWKGVVDFAKAVDAELVTSFATAKGVRDAQGVWTPTQAKAFVDYTHAVGGHIAAAEFMNEPTIVMTSGAPAGYDGAAYGRDFAVFKKFFRKEEPHALLLGPGSAGEGLELAQMKLMPSAELLAGMGPDAVDVFSYHFYGSISSRCAQGPAADRGTSPDAALGEDWLSRTDKVEAFYVKLRDQYEPGKPIWLSETGQAACGGDRWASTFLDSFRYVDQMGSLARRGVQVIMHNTLAASDYALIDDKTMMPRPNYWAALLWHNTMGTTVLNPGPSPSATTHLYAQCMKGHAGGVTLLALNLDRNAAATLMLGARSMRYTLTAADLLGHTVQLNGAELALTSADDVPKPTGVSQAKGTVNLPAASITFFIMPEAHNTACAKD